MVKMSCARKGYCDVHKFKEILRMLKDTFLKGKMVIHTHIK